MVDSGFGRVTLSKNKNVIKLTVELWCGPCHCPVESISYHFNSATLGDRAVNTIESTSVYWLLCCL